MSTQNIFLNGKLKKMSRVARKPVFGVSNEVRHNPASQPQKMARDFSKQRDCTTYIVKTKALISCEATAQLICTFVFADAKCSSDYLLITYQICTLSVLLINMMN